MYVTPGEKALAATPRNREAFTEPVEASDNVCVSGVIDTFRSIASDQPNTAHEVRQLTPVTTTPESERMFVGLNLIEAGTAIVT